MDIKEITKQYTREEFNNNINGNFMIQFIHGGKMYECPSKLGLKDNCKLNSCKKCWKQSTENIKFKGESDMNKRKELELRIKSREEELLKLKEELENVKDTNFEHDIDNIGCYVDNFGKILYNANCSDAIIRNCNYFTNKEYAEKVSYKQYFERKLLAYKDEHGDKCDWSESHHKYTCSLCIKSIEINTIRYAKDSNIYFNSRELLEKHIEENEEEWINYFNICKELD